MSFASILRSIALESYNRRQDVMMVVTALIISLLAGYVIRYDMFGYYENAKVGFFIIVCCSLWMGLFDSILVICGKRDVLERDKTSGMKPVPYILACVVYQAFHAIVQTLVMCIVTWLLIEWPVDAGTLLFPTAVEYFIALFLVTFSAQMLGLAVSAIMKRSEQALTFAPFLLIYELIMSETIFGLPSWLEPLRNTTIVRWGLNSLGTIFDIDMLPWKAESKISEILSSAANQVGDSVTNLGLGIDPSGIERAIESFAIDPSVMGVNHDLPEYLFTSGNLEQTWGWLLILAVVGVVVALIGFGIRRNMR